jgi:hypothetical protein
MTPKTRATSFEDPDAVIVVRKLLQALSLMRSCECSCGCSGERGADHPVVIRALEMAAAFTGEASMTVRRRTPDRERL